MTVALRRFRVIKPARRLQAVVALLALLQLGLQMHILTHDLEFINASITIDDTYYYLQTAWNVQEVGFPTFDGMHPTNGFQFLWFVVVAFLAFLSPAKSVLVYATLAVCFILNALVYVVIWKIGVAVKQPSLALGASIFWLFVTLGTGTYVIGMENSLHALLFWLAIWQTTSFLVQLETDTKPSLTGLSIVLTLNAWARLDSGLFSAFLFLLCVIAAYRACDSHKALKTFRREFASAVVISLIGLAILLAFFRITGGSYLPISALVKQEWAAWEKFTSSTIGRWGTATLVLLALLGWQLNRLYLPDKREIRILIKVWYVMLVGTLVHLVLTERVLAYSFYHWYLSPPIILLVLTAAIAFDWTRDLLERVFTDRISYSFQLMVSCLIVVASVNLFGSHVQDRNPIYVTRYEVASWMSTNLPEDTICASWNAGQLGYYSDRTVINLDGLINGTDYYRRVIKGPMNWPDYVREKGVDCIADYGDRIKSRNGFSLSRTFLIGDGRFRNFHIWQVLPREGSN